MYLEEPIWLVVSAVLVILTIAVYVWHFRHGRLFSAPVSSMACETHHRWKRLILLPMGCTLLALMWLGLGLSQPYRYEGGAQVLRQGVDIMVVLDVSSSMLIEDFKPNRLEHAKTTIAAFAKELTNDRIGLVVFGGEAYVQYPLSFDHELLTQFLPFIQPGALREGTAIGVGLAYGVDRLSASTAKSRIAVLLTDGDNNTGNISPEQATAMASGAHIPVYTLALGREGIVPFPVIGQDFLGNRVKQYQMVTSTINHALLKDIARKTGGSYYRVDDAQVLSAVFREIQKREKSKLPEIYPQRQKIFWDGICFWAALVSIGLAIALGRLFVRVVA